MQEYCRKLISKNLFLQKITKKAPLFKEEDEFVFKKCIDNSNFL